MRLGGARAAQLVRPLNDILVSPVLASRVVQTDGTPIRVLDLRRLPVSRHLLRLPPSLQGWPARRARRRFFNQKDAHRTLGHEALARISQLYDVEKEIAKKMAANNLAAAAAESLRKEMRQEKTAPLLTSQCHWLKEQQTLLLPKNPLREAIDYALNQWEALERYTEQGFLAIDNNAAERAMRHIAIGRKNWLVAESANGSRTAAVLFSLLASATRHGVDLFARLRDVLTRLTAGPPDPDVLTRLLPDRWALAQAAPSSAP